MQIQITARNAYVINAIMDVCLHWYELQDHPYMTITDVIDYCIGHCQLEDNLLLNEAVRDRSQFVQSLSNNLGDDQQEYDVSVLLNVAIIISKVNQVLANI